MKDDREDNPLDDALSNQRARVLEILLDADDGIDAAPVPSRADVLEAIAAWLDEPSTFAIPRPHQEIVDRIHLGALERSGLLSSFEHQEVLTIVRREIARPIVVPPTVAKKLRAAAARMKRSAA